MASESVWESIAETYEYLFDKSSHPHTKNWPLISSPFPLVAILLAYNLFCNKVGPNIMNNRPPYKLETTIKFYNLFQVIINSYIVFEGVKYLFSGNFNFQCMGPLNVYEEHDTVPRTFYIYFLVKLTELLDTVFFVLRKSYRQITFLHLYHHTLMSIVAWYGVKYVPSGQPAIIGTINSFIHVCMYTYYLLSGMGPQYQKYLWWKNYLTIMQIVQFVIILIHSTNSLFHPCSYPAFLKMISVIESLTFIYLFSAFYYRSYIVKGRSNGKKNSIKNKTSSHINESNGLSSSDQQTVKNDDDIKANISADSIKNGNEYKHYSNGKSNGNCRNGKSSKSKLP